MSETTTIDRYTDRIRNAYQHLLDDIGGQVGDYVSLTDLRPYIGGHRPYVDEALRSMSRAQTIHLVPQANQKTLSQADRAEAVTVGGEPNHLVSIR